MAKDEKKEEVDAQKMSEIKDKLEKFQKKIVDKFDKYVSGVSLLPPQKDEEGNIDKDKVNVLVLIDDTDSQKMSKAELKEKLVKAIGKIAEGIDKSIAPEVLIYTELWQACYDGRSEILQLIATSAPIYDTGMLSAVKISEIHKTMVLKKFEKYIVSYVLAGSLVQGRATKDSDIDVFVVIDDTDVKKMTRAELKDKLRAIIIGMGIEAGEMTGVRNKLNIQVYILTDFWDSIKEANPVIFTFLRDGVPFYDRGIFMPWKQLLNMGKIKPSPEAIEMYMSSGEQMLQRVDIKLKEIGMEDIFYALLTPSQAALMLQGMPPPTPKETPEMMRDVFVKKLKLLEPKFVDTLTEVIQLRKDLEHGTKKTVSGKDLDRLLTAGDKYLKRIKKLFTQIEKIKEEEGVLHTYDVCVTIIRDILRLEGVEKVKDSEMVKFFEEEVVSKGLIPEKFLRILKEIEKAKKDYDKGKLTKSEIHNVNKKSAEFIKYMVEYMQRKRGKELERVKIRVKHGKKYGEVILLDRKAFIIHDIDQDDKEISIADITPKGSLKNIKKSNLEELEKSLAKVEIPSKVFLKEPVFEDLKDIFGKDVEVMVNY
ncbi:nucleotidyltransferase domain-containing protein [Desulfosarcina sp.]|nr:nucleotidyltransferase domain-containing protein [Desulfosarcina sp.]